MQFIITAHDGTDLEALKRRLAARESHVKLGNEMRDRGELLFALALLNDQDLMVGSVCVVEFDSREKLDTWLKHEPYVMGKVWETIEIKPCRVGPSFAKINLCR